MKRSATILLAVSLGLLACAKTEQRASLRVGMLSLDADYRELRTVLGVPAKHERAKVLVDRMRAWADDPVFAQRTQSPAFQGDAASFQQQHAFYVQTVDALVQAVETNSPDVMKAYARVNMSCELCHKEFRPGL